MSASARIAMYVAVQGADAGDLEQAAPRLVAVGAGVELETAVGERARELADGARPGGRHGQQRRVGLGERLGRRKEVRERAGRLRQRRAERGDQPRRGGARGGHRHLLAKHRAHGDLAAVGGARDALARPCRHVRRQQRVGAQRGVDRQRVGVEVEQRAAAAHGGGQVAQVGEPQHGGDVGAALASRPRAPPPAARA